MNLTVTHTSTYNVIEFADPFKRCGQCGAWVTGILDRPGPIVVVPCEHESSYRDLCPSWGPVAGCSCLGAHSGYVPHPEPPRM